MYACVRWSEGESGSKEEVVVVGEVGSPNIYSSFGKKHGKRPILLHSLVYSVTHTPRMWWAGPQSY